MNNLLKRFEPSLTDVIKYLQEHQDMILIERNPYQADRLMMMLDNEKLDALDKEFHEHPNGIELPNFIWLMKCAISHAPEDKYELVNGLIKLFQDIDINGDGHMEWAEFTQYIIDAVIGSKDAQLYDTRFEKERELTEIEVLDRAYSRKSKRYIPMTQVDDSNHKNPIKNIAYCQQLDSVICLEQNSQHLRFYTPECQDKKFTLAPESESGKIFIIHFHTVDNYIAAVTSDRQLIFWDATTFKVIKQFKQEVLQTAFELISCLCTQRTRGLAILPVFSIPPTKLWTTFRTPNVSCCQFGSRIKDMLRGMKRYLTKMSLITCSRDEFKSWFESRDKKMELEHSRRKNMQGKKKKGREEKAKALKYLKYKQQTGPVSQTKGVNTYIKVLQQLQEPRRQKPDPKGNKIQKDFEKAQPSLRRAQQAGPPLPCTTIVPYRCGQCQREYKNLKSYTTHIYQTHKKYISPGSSHDIHGRILQTPLTKPSRSPTKPDQTQYPGLTTVALPPLPSCHLDPSRDQVLAFKADLDKQCDQEVMSKFTEEQIDALILEQWQRTLQKQGKIQEEKSEQPQKKQKQPRPCQK